MKILIGLIQPDEGLYKLRGAPVTLRDPASAARHGVGMVFQEGSLVPNLSIMENLFLCHEIGFRKFGLLSQRAMRETACSVLSLVKVTSDLDTPIATQLLRFGRWSRLPVFSGFRNCIIKRIRF